MEGIKEGFSKLADDYFTCGRSYDLVLHLIDVRHDPSKEDIGMLEYLNNNNIPYFVIFTKCDKFSRAQLNRRIKELEEVFDFSEDANIYAVSSVAKSGITDLQQGICDFLKL